VIRSFRHKGLRNFFNQDDARGLRADLVERVRARLSVLHHAESLDDLNIPGWRPHPLRTKPVRIAISVNGPWRITFQWIDGDAHDVDLEQYH
jgi:toxin HigB-1